MNEGAVRNPARGHRYAVRRLMRACNRAALGTIWAADGAPYVSLVAVATDGDGAPILLLSQLSDHTRNIAADPRVSLLFDATARFANPQEGPRATILGTIEPAGGELVRRRYLARHPGAALYAGFADFAFYRVRSERVHWVGGFGRAVWLDASPLVEASLAESVAEAEAGIMAGLAAAHADLADRLARAAGRRGSGWTIAAIDADGCDLARGKRVARLFFPAPLSSPDEAPRALLALAAQPASSA